MAGQCVAVISCPMEGGNDSLTSPVSLIKGILDVEELTAKSKHNFTSSYEWKISNKYYNAAVDICMLQEKTVGNEEFANEVEALVAIFDSKKERKGLVALEAWSSYIDLWEPEIKLAVCERCSSLNDDESDHMSREKAQLWCLDNDFELVELDPVRDDYSEFEDFGITRIRKALTAHMWPNMQLKSFKNHESDTSNTKKQTPSENETIDSSPKTSPRRTDNEARRNVEESIDALLSEPNEFDDDFETLFQKMKVFKDSAAAMPETSRKDYAEKVVTAFWKAIGGDEDELGRISSDEGS
ncbi:alpha- and gamma-adaptin-binding protein p34-like [Clavelina lepadiformis]|uniref:Alpha-and gamma-adaptin-binding protein p34 n=1 Tax=Clavelina lepadiformis TaxID=159417 RepID=A0ABP0H021_CLALP